MTKYLFLLTSSLFCAQQAQAEAVTEPCSGCITVTATGIAQPTDEVGQPLAIITSDEIDRVQGPDIARVLARMPGVSFSRNGPLGAFTGVRVRGAASEALLVLVDGVRMADMASPAGGFDFGTLSSSGIGRIELLRGSNSLVWGSDALGGVMNIATRVEQGAVASLEYGGEQQWSAQASLGHVDDRLSAGLNAGYIHAGGFSSAASGTERDGFEEVTLSGHARFEVAPGLSLAADGRYGEGESEMDGFAPPLFVFGDTHERQDTRQFSGRIGADYTGGALDLRAGFALSDTERDLVDEDLGKTPYYSTDGRSSRAELFGRLRLPAAFRLDFGADKEWTRYAAHDRSVWAVPPGIARGRADSTSGHAMLGYYGERLVIAAGARLDDHSRFGTHWTFGASSSLALGPQLRLRASYGEGFKAPSLFQLLSDYGNAGLKPETSKAWDAGLEYGDRSGKAFVALSLFRRDTRNLIDYVSCWGVTSGICTNRPNGTYDNIGRTRAQGFELELGYALSPALRLQGVWSHVRAKDRTQASFTQGNALARRPRNTGTLSLDWTGPADLSLGMDLRVAGPSFDDAWNTTRLSGYALADIRASVPVSQRLELFGRIENLWNEHYQTAAGYDTQGRAAFVGARLRM